MQKLIKTLQKAFPKLRFTAGKQFYWSPETSEIFYKEEADSEQARWSLLHETGHALLKHQSYTSDFELLQLETAAWSQAEQLAKRFDITIDQDHVQDCLDTYRDWLHKRSICPSCSTQSLQQDDHRYYRCYNCHTTWRVSPNRFGRAYRSTKHTAQATTLQEISFGTV